MTREQKRDQHENQAEGFIAGWFVALLLGVYLGRSGNGGWLALALIGGLAFAAFWYHVYWPEDWPEDR